jgi:hypothetical protein
MGRNGKPIGVCGAHRRGQPTGEASSPLRQGGSSGTMSYCSGELASPSVPTYGTSPFHRSLSLPDQNLLLSRSYLSKLLMVETSI